MDRARKSLRDTLRRSTLASESEGAEPLLQGADLESGTPPVSPHIVPPNLRRISFGPAAVEDEGEGRQLRGTTPLPQRVGERRAGVGRRAGAPPWRRLARPRCTLPGHCCSTHVQACRFLCPHPKPLPWCCPPRLAAGPSSQAPANGAAQGDLSCIPESRVVSLAHSGDKSGSQSQQGSMAAARRSSVLGSGTVLQMAKLERGELGAPGGCRGGALCILRQLLRSRCGQVLSKGSAHLLAYGVVCGPVTCIPSRAWQPGSRFPPTPQATLRPCRTPRLPGQWSQPPGSTCCCSASRWASRRGCAPGARRWCFCW